jgi:preprotein translocase SecE subunit
MPKSLESKVSCISSQIPYNPYAPAGAFSKKTSSVTLLNYFRSATEELKHVTWPTRRQALRLSTIVLGFILVSAVIYGFIDLLLGQGMLLLLFFTPQH